MCVRIGFLDFWEISSVCEKISVPGLALPVSVLDLVPKIIPSLGSNFVNQNQNQLVSTRVLPTLWSPPVSLNQERHTKARSSYFYFYFIYKHIGGLRRPCRSCAHCLGRFGPAIIRSLPWGLPQTQTSKNPASDVDTHLAMVSNLWTNSNYRLRLLSSTRLSRNSAAFYFSCVAIFPFLKNFEISILLATFLPPAPKKRNQRL